MTIPQHRLPMRRTRLATKIREPVVLSRNGTNTLPHTCIAPKRRRRIRVVPGARCNRLCRNHRLIKVAIGEELLKRLNNFLRAWTHRSDGLVSLREVYAVRQGVRATTICIRVIVRVVCSRMKVSLGSRVGRVIREDGNVWH